MSSKRVLQEDSKIKVDLIEKYTSMAFEYLAIMQNSDIIRTMENRAYAVQLGLSAITHIFKLAFINTKNISTTESYYQKGIYCYIEYLEQFNKLSATQQIDYADAVGFIYDKTLSDLHANGSSSVFTNILSVSQSHQAQDGDFAECVSMLQYAGRITSTLLWFNNENITLLDQMDIVEHNFVDFICAASIPGLLDPTFMILETIQQHIVDITAKEYADILSSMKKRFNGASTHKETRTVDEILDSVRDACLLLGANYSGKTLKYVAEQEVWKKPAEDLVKTLFLP